MPFNTCFAIPSSSLLIFLVIILSHLSLHSPSLSLTLAIPPSFRQESDQSRPTVAAILDEDLTDNNKPCCRNLSRFDIFARLVHQSGIFSTLQDPTPITLLAPNDLAVNQTAEDLAELFQLPLAQSESDAYSVINFFFNQFRQPNEVLRDVIRFHILKQSQSFDQLVNGRHTTCLRDHDIQSLGPALQAVPPGTILGRGAHVIVGPDIDLKASNGYLLPIDRVMFPDLSGYSLKPSSNLTDVISTSPTPHPTFMPDTDNPTPTSETGFPDSIQSPSPSVTPSQSVSLPNPSNPACFSASAFVTLHDDTQVPLFNLLAGQRIKANENVSSPVYLFTHRQPSIRHRFIRITSRHNHTIILSPGHYLYANGRLKPASKVRKGHILRTLDGPSTVISARWTVAYGLFAPHTIHGDIVVNRVIASTYTTAVHPKIAHAFLWPIRALVHAGLAVEPLGSLLYGSHFGIAEMLRKWWDWF